MNLHNNEAGRRVIHRHFQLDSLHEKKVQQFIVCASRALSGFLIRSEKFPLISAARGRDLMIRFIDERQVWAGEQEKRRVESFEAVEQKIQWAGPGRRGVMKA